jgi:hypothetical protein
MARFSAVSTDRPGCYALRATVTAQGSQGPVVRTSAPVTARAVDTTLAVTYSHPTVFGTRTSVTARQAISGAVTVAKQAGLTTSLSVRLTGPITPASGNCGAGVSQWRGAPTSSIPAAATNGVGDGGGLVAGASTPFTAEPPAAIGCYRQRIVLTLRDGSGGGTLDVPASTDAPLFVLAPAARAQLTQTWTVAPQPVAAQVAVDGLFGQPAHVRMQVYAATPSGQGCARARYSAPPVSAGASVPMQSQGWVSTATASSGPLVVARCYSLVPEVSLDANPGVRTSPAPGAAGSTLVAGVQPITASAAAVPPTDRATLVVFAAVGGSSAFGLLIVSALVGLVAWRQRRPADEIEWPLLTGRAGG